MKQQTALQSFWDKIALHLSVTQINEFLPEFEKAISMEKKHIRMAFENGEHNIDPVGNLIDSEGAEKYYNETYQNKSAGGACEIQ